MNRFLFLVLIVLFSIPAYSQYTITGSLMDKGDGTPLSGAGVLLRSVKDSSMVKGVVTNSNGSFRIEDVKPTNYLITIRYIGYRDLTMPIKISGANLDLKRLELEQSALRMKGLSIVEDAIAVVQKDDTSEYNAAAFKVNPDATSEDLVAKMPGVVIQDGKIQAQGTEVKKVFVDGKPFFGNDPSAALKNLPAEAVDKVQVFDSKSDQAQFTGFDDDDVSKAINIITKLPFRNGAFGRAFAGYGYEDKWRGGVLANVFQGDRRITIMLNTNNVNEQNFTIDDIVGAMSSVSGGMSGGGGMRMMGGGGGNAMRMGGGGGGMRTNFMNTSSGINTTNSLGINFLDQLGKKVEFSGSYFFNYTKNETTSETNRQYITAQQLGLIYKENNESNSINMNHRLNFKIDYKIDSANSLLFEPRLTIQQATGKSFFEGQNLLETLLTNETRTRNSTESFGWNTALPILYRHSFAKRGRTFSVNVTPSFNQTNADNEQQSYYTYIDTVTTADTLNQLANLNKKGTGLSGNFIYTEPLNKNLSLMVSYYGNYNNNNSDKRNNEYNPATQSYSVLDTSLSNVFKSEYYSNSGGLSLKYGRDKWYVAPGVSLQASRLSNEQIFPSIYNFSKSFSNVLPYVEYQYRFSKTNNLRINYRTSTKEPGIDDLQEVLDNSNPVQLSIGNQELNQSWQNTLNIRYSISNPAKGTNLFFSLSGTYTLDYIGRQTIIASESKQYYGVDLQPGYQLTRPMNFDNYYNMRTFAGFGLLIKPLKTNFNINVSGGYTHSPSLINDNMNYSNTSNAGLGLVFSSNISEKVDFMLSSNSSMNYVENTLQSSQNSKYLRQDVRFRINLMPIAGLVIQTELNDQYYSSFEGNSDQNYLLWNAAIGYKFLKKRQLEVKLSVYDILNQNENLTRNTTETYYEDVITNTLTQYFMLSLSWNFTTFKSSVPQDMINQPQRREFRGDGPPPPGIELRN